MSSIQKKKSEIFQKGSTTFYNATKFFPPLVRDDITTLYAFVRVADYYVDSIPQQPFELNQMKKDLEAARQGEIIEDGIVRDFVELETRCGFNPAWANAFFHSMEMDLEKKQIENETELRAYCYGSAAVIGLFISKIVGVSEEAYPHAEALGNAFQFINFIRDIHEDYDLLGRVYIPADELAACGLSLPTRENAQANRKGFEQLIQIQIERYLSEQKIGLQGIHYLPLQIRPAILTAADMYHWTAVQIAKNPMIVYTKKVKPSKTRVLLQGVSNYLITQGFFNRKDGVAQNSQVRYTQPTP